MAVNLKRLVYFDSFMDPVANAILSKRDDVDLVRLDYAASEAGNWSEFSAAHGYQIQPRSELRKPWFADADLLALDREADAAPPFLPPLCAAGWPVLFPLPEPPGFFPPASSLLTVAHARRSASFSGTPRSS